ncbi:TonB-dependent siderophore receptor [Roseateles sp. DAIF2]|uniref:TonB-dependent siderophore receptor n=1 Tax=Roseateles sp. DAIF2 TaxID=2714952 RepID=UPI0018A2AC3D|nr:TonB-dependent siderophore receptor [Roseateles sp. DAIF2]QPF73513.1 TonB-dependent siderophore receptor [Roseateles sp. DAIF2]
MSEISGGRLAAGALLLGAFSLNPLMAAAQEAIADTQVAALDANGTAQLGKVVMTVNRESNLSLTKMALTRRETPQSLSLMDRQRIELESLLSINDVLLFTPGVVVSFYDTQRPLYYARGFQITDFQVDGVPTYSGSTNQEYDTALYERIEVIRGANGLLSGPGNPSATVNMVRKRAHKGFDASVVLSAGSWNKQRIEGDFNTSLSADGRVRGRLVASYQDSDSFRKRYNEEKGAWLATVEADLLPGTTLILGHQNQNNNPAGAIWGTIPRFAADGSLANLPRETSFSPHWTKWERESGTTYVTLDQRLGESWSLKALYNRTKGSFNSLRVYGDGYPDAKTGAGMTLLAGVGEGTDLRDSLDLFATGRFSLLGREHDLMLGATYSKLTADTPTLSSVTTWNYPIPNLATWDGNAPRPSYQRTGASRIATTEQSGIFASARWRVGDAMSLITGVRVSNWKTGTDNYGINGAYTNTSGAFRVKDEVTPYLGLVYELNKEFSLYTSYTDIFKPQNLKDKQQNLLAPVLGSNTELGIKGELLDKRLAFSFALFEAKQDNYGVLDPTVSKEEKQRLGFDPYYGVNGTKSRGFELDLNGSIRAGWTVNAAFSQTKITRNRNDKIWANLPEHQLQLSTSYQLPGAWERLTVGGGLNWQSKITGYDIPHPTLKTVTVTQKAYSVVNLHASYRISEQLSATLSLRNALDESYWANLDYPNYGEPRNVLLSLRARF